MRHVQKPLLRCLIGERAQRKPRDDAQMRVCAGELVARGERFAMHHARVDEEHVEVESFFVGQAAQERSGALHAGKDGGAWAEYLVHKAKNFDRSGMKEALVQSIERVGRDAHGARASTTRAWSLGLASLNVVAYKVAPDMSTSPSKAQSSGRIVHDLGRRKFLFVTGKGGVGKTTFSAALAVALAREGKRVLVALCNTKERLSAIMGTKPIGDEIVPVADGVWAVNISPEKALFEYGAMVLKVRAVAHAVFDNKYTSAFFRAVPGLHEWAMLGKAWFHTTELLDNGKPRFDVVLLDAPATGHGIDMLRVPKVILDVVPPGVLRRDAEAAWAMFRDPKQSGVVVVTLPEEMPAQETLDLIGAIERDLSLPVLRLVINGVLPPLFTPDERDRLAGQTDLLAIDAPERAQNTPESALVAGARRAVREKVQAESLARLNKESKLPRIELPYLFDEASTVQGTRMLADLL